MAGEHILKLLIDTSARISYSNREMIVECNEKGKYIPRYSVFEYKKYGRKPIVLTTNNEEEACRILKGE